MTSWWRYNQSKNMPFICDAPLFWIIGMIFSESSSPIFSMIRTMYIDWIIITITDWAIATKLFKKFKILRNPRSYEGGARRSLWSRIPDFQKFGPRISFQFLSILFGLRWFRDQFLSNLTSLSLLKDQWASRIQIFKTKIVTFPSWGLNFH